jgi:tricorn protease
MKRKSSAALAMGVLLVAALSSAQTPAPLAAGALGYYRFPTLRGNTLVFAAEGDLWAVSPEGGLARRLTTHPAQEADPVLSPDGRTLAFTARYEGPVEVYTMPVEGGVPVRRTYEAEPSTATNWTPSGELVYTTQHFATLPDPQLVSLNLKTGDRTRVPLSQASEGSYDASGRTIYFVRPSFHNNVTKRYKGGRARKIWKYTQGQPEAQVLTQSYAGENHSPLWWNGRVYFVSDRDGTMNIWSMDETGGDPKQHTKHAGWDVKRPSLDAGRIVYQAGADLWLYDIAKAAERMIPITIPSDFDQLREKWAKRPMEMLTSVHLHPKGESVVLTARGRVFVAPSGSGRLVLASRKPGVRYRDVRFMPDGKNLLALSDVSGELEFATLPTNGVGDEKALTADGKVLRFDGHPSPDGKWVVYTDNNNGVWLLNVASKTQTMIAPNREGGFDFAWTPDSRWIAWSQTAGNSFVQILLYNVETKTTTPVTSDRVNSQSASFSPDGKWLYFLSDRNLTSIVEAPWGPRAPEPFFDKPMKMYQVALRKGLRSPFKPVDELHPDTPEKPDGAKTDSSSAAKPAASASPSPTPTPSPSPTPSTPPLVEIDLDGLQLRVYEVTAAGSGDFRDLSVVAKVVFWLATDPGGDGKTHLMALEIANKDPKPSKVMEDITSYEVSGDGKKLLVRRREDLFVIDAGTKAPAPADLGKSRIDLSGWTFPIEVREDWKQIFVDAWRMERDYFYDPNMHGVDWNAVLKRHLPLVDRITTREELSDLIGWMVGELSVLHTSVAGGDLRPGPDDIRVPTLGARLVRDVKAGGYRIDYIYRHDPDYPDERSPFADPELNVNVGDIVTAVNGVDALSTDQFESLLRGQERRQVLVRLKSGSSATAAPRDIIVVPTTEERNLRYTDWEYTRRLAVEEKSKGSLGYVHLRAMGGGDLTSWYRHFYPAFNREGIVIDVRHNNGGNIDAFILEKLMRRAWMYWKSRAGEPYWNMMFAPRGHLVVLVDENTASDGEAFAEGFRRLGMGKVIGMRTWGGEVWLSGANRLSDGGVARAPMNGVYGPESQWLIENHGVDPDIVVDNLPRATFDGKDAQLDAAIEHLLAEIKKDPRPVPKPPAYPDKSFKYPQR